MVAKKPYLAIKTIGCRLNQAESQELAESLARAGMGIVSDKKKADMLLVNTCAVTLAATRKSRQALRAYHHRWPKAKIVVLGCSEPELKKLPEVYFSIPMKDKGRVAEIIKKQFKIYHPAGKTIDTFLATRRTRALVKIQDGCDEFCSYCIVPLRRGKPVSVPVTEVISKIRQLEAGGFKEIVLTGVHVGLYRYRNTDFLGLVKKILTQSNISRIRFSSLEPQHLTPEIIALFRAPRVCPFLHLPIQSGQDKILAAMRRRYTVSRLVGLVQKIRKKVPGVFLSADIMVGFPGETEADFRQTVALCRRLKFAKIHVFSYSKRKGTPASRYPEQLDASTMARRRQQLQRLSDQLNAEYRRKFIGKRVEILLETANSGICREGFKVKLNIDLIPNTLVAGKILTVTSNQTIAKLIQR